MNNYSIAHAVVSISTPGSTVFAGNETESVALARLLNEWMAQLVNALPKQFSYFGVMPLPYVSAAAKEADYVLKELGAVGVGLLSNHEGLYLGNPLFTPFFSHLNAGKSSPTVLFVHPSDPYLRKRNGYHLESADPSMSLVP